MEACQVAVYGLGVMGSCLARNLLRKGFRVAVYSVAEPERAHFCQWEEAGRAMVCDSEEALLASLESPRRIFLMITAGKPVDMVLGQLLPRLAPGDVVLDGGNSYYRDTERREELCRRQGIHYLGVGVSGGERGALHGPSMMAGGSPEGYALCQDFLTAMAAQAEGKPCCAYIGTGGAGHYVKMVHNGIEYGILELLAEAYQWMGRGLGWDAEQIRRTFAAWKGTELDSYLAEISEKVMRQKAEDGAPLVEKILDVAGQKGTGKWTALEGIERGVYIPTIYEAVSARNVSGNRERRLRGAERRREAQRAGQPRFSAAESLAGEKALRRALYLGMITCFSQGFDLIRQAAGEMGWQIHPGDLAQVWRDGCIIRCALLNRIQKAAAEEEDILFSREFAEAWGQREELAAFLGQAEQAGVSLPGFAASLHYLDSLSQERMPVSFIQALRDCFGAHTYQRVDRPGTFHTQWEEEED